MAKKLEAKLDRSAAAQTVWSGSNGSSKAQNLTIQSGVPANENLAERTEWRCRSRRIHLQIPRS